MVYNGFTVEREPLAKGETMEMDTFTACEIIEGDTSTREEAIAAMQYLIDTGIVWKLQGFYGRAAKDMIERGDCHWRNNSQNKD